MSKRCLGLCAAAALLALAAAPVTVQAQDKALNIYNWNDYIGPNVIPGFEKETGIHVTYDMYDANETLEAKLSAGASGYDIAVPTLIPFLARDIKAGLYQKIDKSKLKNWGNLDPSILNIMGKFDKGNEYAVPWIIGTDGIAINVQKVKAIAPDAPLNSYDLLFKPEWASKFKDCGIEIIDSPQDVFSVALNYLGFNPTTENSDELNKAYELLYKLRANVRKFDSSGYINDLANGDACIAFGYSSDIKIAAKRAREAGKDFTVDYVIPKEGTLIYIDALTIPAGAPHYDAALQWIDYNLRPEVIAETTNTIGGRNGNLAALKFVNPEIANDPTIYPPPEVMKTLFEGDVGSPAMDRLRSRLWTRIKTGR
ncbi:MAG TPA: polyamine ABC transporter substrate-binding protein [Candidatus Sulfotelmatobacter sp.]|jgi:putrescine transport system substrate-binding protein|nr:polyamine ABC transporter substrate-binding protein [Candidatus Sulfotelmatobacter sp.]